MKKVLIVFGVLLLPLSYIIYTSYLVDNFYKDFDYVYCSKNQILIKEKIKSLDRISKLLPWSKGIKRDNIELNLKIHNYRTALNQALKIDDHLLTGIIYEFMHGPDSAKKFYKMTIKPMTKKIDKIDKIEDRYFHERALALIYNYIGNYEQSEKYLKEIPLEIDYNIRKLILRYDYYIESYPSGGFKDFIYGNTITMKNDSLLDCYVIDSLINVNKFYFEEYSSAQIEGKVVNNLYEFNEVFKDKALALGFKEIDCNEKY